MCFTFKGQNNKPGTAQVGAISKAQKIEGGAFWRQKNFAKKSHSAEKNWKGDLIMFSRTSVYFFCFAQGSEISSVLNLRVLNLPQVVEQMN